MDDYMTDGDCPFTVWTDDSESDNPSWWYCPACTEAYWEGFEVEAGEDA